MQEPVPMTAKAAAVKKVKWTVREDQTLVLNVHKYGISRWPPVAAEIPGRTGKQCRERWINQLDPNLNREKWAARRMRPSYS
jgi:myb proto-oncogene protein